MASEDDQTAGLIEFYKEICTNIRATDDISFNILRAVPVVSALGSGALTFLQSPDQPSNQPACAVAALALLGALVTVGLFRWELRNIQKCKWLIACAGDVEHEVIDKLLLTTKGRPPFRGMISDGDPKPAKMDDTSVSSKGKWLRPRKWGKTESAKLIYAAAVVAWLIPVAIAVQGPRDSDQSQPSVSSTTESSSQ